MVKLGNKIMYSVCGAGAGLAGIVAGGSGCSGSCPSCLGCAAAGTGILAAVLFGRYKSGREAKDGLA